MTYAEEVGSRLRDLRVERGLSLQDVERASDGQWKAAVIGSYERGDRNISAARLCELAEFYGIQPGDVLPEGPQRAPDRSRGIVLDLGRLADGERWRGVRRYCESIQRQRGDYNRQLLSVRGEDLRALAVILDVEEDELVDELQAAGVLVD